MKHMWSEEEIQEQAKIENLVDAKGRNRFIEIEGTPGEKEGMHIYYGKCVLNGNNLIFEIEGNFTKSNGPDFPLCKFTLPEWIAQKIHLGFSNVVDFVPYSQVSTDGIIETSLYCIYKEGNVLNFSQYTSVNAPSLTVFKIRYNIIISE